MNITGLNCLSVCATCFLFVFNLKTHLVLNSFPGCYCFLCIFFLYSQFYHLPVNNLPDSYFQWWEIKKHHLGATTSLSKKKAARLVPVQRGGGLSETHVCSLVTLLRGINSHWASLIVIIIPIMSVVSQSSTMKERRRWVVLSFFVFVCFFLDLQAA